MLHAVQLARRTCKCLAGYGQVRAMVQVQVWWERCWHTALLGIIACSGSKAQHPHRYVISGKNPRCLQAAARTRLTLSQILCLHQTVLTILQPAAAWVLAEAAMSGTGHAL